MTTPPTDDEQRLHDAAARAFAHHAAEAAKPAGRTRSLWSRRLEPWVLAAAALGFVGWAVLRVLMSR